MYADDVHVIVRDWGHVVDIAHILWKRWDMSILLKHHIP